MRVVVAAADVLPAIFGLVGVAVGGLVTGFVSSSLEKGREKAESLAAARLLRTEVIAASADVSATLKEGKWPIAYKPTWSQSWSTYRRSLAVRMDDEAFDEVAKAYALMDQLQSGFGAGRPEAQRDLSHPDRVFLDRVAPVLEGASQRLDEFLGPRPKGPVAEGER
jgi:hypothetical protein